MAQGDRQPNVLHVNDARTWRGGEQQTLYLAQGMIEVGERARIVCRPGCPLADKARAAGVPVHEVRMRMELDLAAAWRIARIARREGCNILHAHTAHAHMLAWLARAVFRAPCHVVVHRRIEFPVAKRHPVVARLKYGRCVDAYIAISNRVRETLVEAGIEPWRIFPVRSVTDPGRFVDAPPDPDLRRQLGIPEDAWVVGNIGYLVDHKDHANLLRAAGRARDHVPNMWVAIVGPGPLHDALAALAGELGLADRVVFTGFRSDIPQIIQMFDLFALSSSEEGICSTLLDVMACGRPIVATDAGGVREAVLHEQTGLIVPIRDSEALAAGIVRMAREGDLARRWAAAGRRRVLENFTVEMLTRRTLAAYQRVLAGEVGPAYPIEPAP